MAAKRRLSKAVFGHRIAVVIFIICVVCVKLAIKMGYLVAGR
jgi:hypothetical protein